MVILTLQPYLVLNPHACPAPPMIFVNLVGRSEFVVDIKFIGTGSRVNHAIDLSGSRRSWE